ncbi:MAG TPA: hypothetical protein VFB15_01140 [Candidatus Binataceae bacterium]|nr:hypothetical protein [Candidatus Binataceae bacterium]
MMGFMLVYALFAGALLVIVLGLLVAGGVATLLGRLRKPVADANHRRRAAGRRAAAVVDLHRAHLRR